MPLSRTPTLAELLNHMKDRTLRDIHVALPARVESYDASTQLADVQPLIMDRFEAEAGVSSMQLPVITNVPIVFPGAGGFHITFPVQKGDEVLVIFADKSLDAWQAQGGISDPDDSRRHHLTDAIAIPGLHNNKGKIQGVDAGVITIGKDSESADWVALATATKNEIIAVRDILNALVTRFNLLQTALVTHVHPAGTPSVGVSPGLAGFTTAADTPASVGDVKSSTVKVKG